MEATGNRIIIGLDYGTTYSGVALASVRHNQHDINVNGDDIQDVISWPGKGLRKVPSVISYSRAEGLESQWGFEISKHAIRMIWTKLELDGQASSQELDLLLKSLDGMKDLDFGNIDDSEGLPAYPAKDPVQIITDYLSRLREHLFKLELGPLYGHDLFITPVDIVITCPAEWSDSAISKTFRAVTAAGFNNNYFPTLNNIILAAEPEAAAHFVIKSIHQNGDSPGLKIGDCVVHCDAGGGTVDVASFKVTQVDPDLIVEPIGRASSKKCGATFLDREFDKILERKVGADELRRLKRMTRATDMAGHTALGPELSHLMEEWEKLKMNFEGNEKSSLSMWFPESQDRLEIPEHGISQGYLYLTVDEVREAFKFSVDNTASLIKRQINQVERLCEQVKLVTLSGGFACSKYFYKVISNDLLRARGIPTKRPADEQDCWSAVARGAVLHGLQRDTSRLVYMRPCRRNYGVKTSQPFSLFKHGGGETYPDPFDGETKAANQMTWLIAKGDLILSNKGNYSSIQICRRFGIDDSRSFCTYLMANDDDNAPEGRFHKNMYRVATLNYDLSRIPKEEFEKRRTPDLKRSYYLVELRLHLMVKDDVQFWVTFKDRELGTRVRIPYT